MPLSSHSLSPPEDPLKWGGKLAFLVVLMSARRVSRGDIEIDRALLCTRQVGEAQCRRPEGALAPPASKAALIGEVTPKERCMSRNRWDCMRRRRLRALWVSRASHRR
jgi:hypothetical protein